MKQIVKMSVLSSTKIKIKTRKNTFFIMFYQTLKVGALDEFHIRPGYVLDPVRDRLKYTKSIRLRLPVDTRFARRNLSPCFDTRNNYHRFGGPRLSNLSIRRKSRVPAERGKIHGGGKSICNKSLRCWRVMQVMHILLCKHNKMYHCEKIRFQTV